MKQLVWASVHQPTKVQLEELEEMGNLTFLDNEMLDRLTNTPSDRVGLINLATKLDNLVGDATLVQPSGSLAFIHILGFIRGGVYVNKKTIFAHSERVSKDIPQADGSVKKISTFKHLGWI